MNKALILIGTFLLSVGISLCLILSLPGHYHQDEFQVQSSEVGLDWTRSWDNPDQSAVALIGQNFKFTMILQLVSFLIVLFFSFILSFVALNWERLIIPLEKTVAIGISAPTLFWIPLLVSTLSLKFDFFPLRFEPTLRGWILPLVALSLRPLCIGTEILLKEWKKVEFKSYFLVARSKGLSRIQVFYRHGLKNALIPFSSQMGNFLVQSLMGSVLVESLFSFPGIGNLFVQSLQNRDLPIVLYLTLLFTFLMMIVHATIEIIQKFLEPRGESSRT